MLYLRGVSSISALPRVLRFKALFRQTVDHSIKNLSSLPGNLPFDLKTELALFQKRRGAVPGEVHAGLSMCRCTHEIAGIDKELCELLSHPTLLRSSDYTAVTTVL